MSDTIDEPIDLNDYNSSAFQVYSEKDEAKFELYALEIKPHEVSEDLPFLFTNYIDDYSWKRLLIGSFDFWLIHFEFNSNQVAWQFVFIPIKEYKNETYLPIEIKAIFN